MAALRPWKDPAGRAWSVYLDSSERFEPGALFVFTCDPKDGMSSPKVLVRGVPHVHANPEGTLPFYLEAARSGGFVWRDRDGTPWHISNRTCVRSESGRALEVQRGGSHRELWRLSDGELGDLVGLALGL